MGSVKLAFLAAFALGLVASDVQGPAPSLIRFPAPIKQTIDGAPAWCIEAATNVRVCDIDQHDRGFTLTLFVDRMPTILAKGRWGVYEGQFELLLTDLDADGNDELIVVDHIATSNGMAMTIDRISIVANYRRDDRTWVSFTVDEFGTGPGTFVRQAGRSGFAIFSTEWERYTSLDPQRGYGTYLVGRWFRYEGGRLRAEPGILVRRLLNSLDAERSKPSDNRPYSFFTDGKSRTVERDPALAAGNSLGTLRGIIERVNPDGYGGASFDLRLDDGRRTNAIFGYPYGENPGEHIDHLALTSINRVLPEGVLPAAVIGDVTGRRVRLERYQDGKGEQRVLWID